MLASIHGHLPAHVVFADLQLVILDDYGSSLSGLTREQLSAAEQAVLTQLVAWGIVPQPVSESCCLSYGYLSIGNYEGVRLCQYEMRLEE